MPLVHREPRGTDNYNLWGDYDAKLVHLGLDQFCVQFSTNPDGEKDSRYFVTFTPNDFGELAAAMMKADPTAAIKAFGSAMQEMPNIPKPTIS